MVEGGLRGIAFLEILTVFRLIIVPSRSICSELVYKEPEVFSGLVNAPVGWRLDFRVQGTNIRFI